LAVEKRQFGHGKEENCAWMFEAMLWRTARSGSGALGASPHTASAAPIISDLVAHAI